MWPARSRVAVPRGDRSIGTSSTQTTVGATGLDVRKPDQPAFDQMSPAIAVRNLSFAYPGDPRRPALDGVSLEVVSGELVAVIGANGTGKSTLLKLIAGLLDAGRGTVAIRGTQVRGPSPDVGFVFQEPRLLPWRSSLANVAFPLELAGWSRTSRDGASPRPARAGRYGGCRAAAPAPTLGRHASARRHRACPRPRAESAAPGRAVQRPRRLDPGALQRACCRRSGGRLAPPSCS